MYCFFFNDTATTEIYTLSLHDALPILKNINIICPGFSADCLETLEEIDIQNREFFIKAGGEKFNYIPALNDDGDHIELLSNIILKHTNGWPEFSKNWDQEKIETELSKSKERAEKSIYNKN